MTDTKQFHIGDLLTITTGHLVSHDHIGGVYALLDWMTGESLFTHQLPRAADVAKPFLESLYPELAEIKYPDYLKGDGASNDAIFTWVDSQAELHKQWYDVPMLPVEAYDAKDALTELAEMMGPDKKIVGVVT